MTNADDNSVIFEPVPKQHHRSEWTAKLLAVKEAGRPGRVHTAATPKEANTVAVSVRSAAAALQGLASERGHWDVFARTLPTGGGGVWAVYNPPESADPEGELLPEPVSAQAPATPEPYEPLDPMGTRPPG